MYRARVLLLVSIVVIAAAVIAPMAMAAGPAGSSMAVVVIDGKGIKASSQETAGLALSTAGLVGNLRADYQFAFVNAERPSLVLGPVGSATSAFKEIQDEIAAQLASEPVASGNSMYSALAATHNLMGLEQAAPGSAVYIVLGESAGEDLGRLLNRISPLIANFATAGWAVNTIVPSNASAAVNDFARTVTSATGGQRFTLSVPDGLNAVASSLMRDSAAGTLQALTERAMERSAVFSSPLDIPPGTRDTTLVFFKSDTLGALRLTDPNGVEAAIGASSTYYIANTPHVVVWRLVDPQPGQWRVDASGMAGALSVWHYSSNRYSLRLATPSPMPVGDTINLVAYVSEGRGPVKLADVQVLAHVRMQDGTTVAYNLNDAGFNGDSVAGDGYYSVELLPLETGGDYRTELVLMWSQFGHQVSTETALAIRNFPDIEVRPLPLTDLESGQRTKIATLFVHVNGEPYPVDAQHLSASIGSSGASDAAVEFVPQRTSGSGQAWLFDVYAVPQGGGAHNITYQIDLPYGGRDYTRLSQSMIIRSLAPPAPVLTELTVVPEPVISWLPVPLWMLILVPSLAVGLAGASYLAWMLRTKPKGYLYTDGGELVADFAAIKRNPVLSYIFPSSVFGRELKVPGLENVVFGFRGNRVSVRASTPQVGVRVNNEPLARLANVYHKSWIGTRGRLYSFLMAKPKVQAMAMGDDD